MFLTFAVSSWEENVQCLVDIYVQQRFQFEVVVFYASSLEQAFRRRKALISYLW
jgi:hypothetical protein